MRIIHTIPSTYYESSGPSYSVTRLCESLQDQGHQVALAALALGTSSIKEQKTFALGYGPERLGRSPQMKRWLYQEALSKKVNVFHNHGMWHMSAIYPCMAAQKGRVALVTSPRGAFSDWAMQHGSKVKKMFWPLLQKPALQQVTCFHATCEAEYDDIRRLGFKQPIAIIPNGVDLPPLRVKQHNPTRTLLFLGRLHRVKGIDRLLQAWHHLEKIFPEWQLVIAGSDEGPHGKSGYLDELQAMATRLELKRVLFSGEQRGDEKLRCYQSADLYILPSHSENFAMTVAEALASGIPVVASKGTPWSALVQKGAGWWIDVDVDSLVCCLENIFSLSPETLRVIGSIGRQWMEADFAWARIGEKMSATYEWLINPHHVRPDWIEI